MLLPQPQPSQQSARWAFARLLEHHANNEAIGGLVLELCGLPDRDVHDFARKVIDTAKDDRVRGISCLGLALALMNDPRTRGHSEGGDHPRLGTCGERLWRSADRRHQPAGNGRPDAQGGQAAERRPHRRQHHRQGQQRPAVSTDGLSRESGPARFLGRLVPLLPGHVSSGTDAEQEARGSAVCHCGGQLRIPGSIAAGRKERECHVAVLGGRPRRADRRAVERSSYPTLFLLDHRGAIRLKGNVRGPVLDAAVGRLLEESDLGLSHDLVPPSSVWSYFDEGTEPKGDWRKLEFDDSEWNSGRGVLGYGNGDEATPVDFGPDPRLQAHHHVLPAQIRGQSPAGGCQTRCQGSQAMAERPSTSTGRRCFATTVPGSRAQGSGS